MGIRHRTGREGMMRRNISAILLLLILSGCGHGFIGKLPGIEDSNNVSEIIFIRECELVGSVGKAPIYLDGNFLFKIGACEYTRFILPSGQHKILLKGYGIDYGLDINLLPKNKYYYIATMGKYIIYAIPEKTAIHKINNLKNENKYMQIDKTIGPIHDQ